MNDFKDQIVVINGGTSGIGREAVKQFAERGAIVHFTGRREQEGKKTEEAAGKKTTFHQVDNTNRDQIADCMAKILEAEGRIDILFNNAGVLSLGTGPLNRVKEDDWDELIATNQTAYFLYMKHALNAMQKQKSGVIVNNAAILGNDKVNPMLPAYSGTKAAIVAMTKSTALRFAKQGVRVNAISPGPAATELSTKAYGSQEAFEKAAKDAPRGSYAEPREIVNAVRFLASDEASYVNGTELVVDGGYSLK